MPKLPNLQGGGIAGNNSYMKNNLRGSQKSGTGLRGLPNLNVFNKYTSGMGGGIGSSVGGNPGIGGGIGGGIGNDPYSLNYNENRQGG